MAETRKRLKMTKTALRNRGRYDSFLRWREVWPDLTFHEFLTLPYFKEKRAAGEVP